MVMLVARFLGSFLTIIEERFLYSGVFDFVLLGLCAVNVIRFIVNGNGIVLMENLHLDKIENETHNGNWKHDIRIHHIGLEKSLGGFSQ